MAKTHEQAIKDLQKALEAVSKYSQKTDDHWHEIGKVIDKAAQRLDQGFVKALHTFTGTSGLAATFKSAGHAIANAFTGSTDYAKSLKQALDLKNLEAMMARGYAAKKALRAEAAKIEQHWKSVRVLTDEVSSAIKSKAGVAAMAFAGELLLAFKYSKEINEQLIHTSAEYSNRRRLATEIAQIQAATGNEMQDMAKAGAALANYGFDLRSDFQSTLKTVVLLEEGLGVSNETSAQMAVAVKRIGGDFDRVANTLARIKADTALSADEAARFATQISKAVMMLKPGSGSLVDQTTDYISRVAAALKELTGDGKGFVDMLSSFTTEAGMMGAATLGATPDFLASPAQTKMVTERFVKYVNQQLSGTSGFQRMATIQLLSEQFNTTADVIANADEMLKKYNETKRNETTLEKEWRMQTSELGKTLSKMYNSMAAVIQETLLPVIRHLNPVLETLTKGLQWVTKSGYALYLGVGLLAASAIGAAITIHRLTAAITKMAITSGLMSNVVGGVPGKLGSFKTAISSFFDITRSPLLARPILAGGRASGAILGAGSRLSSLVSSVMTWLPRIGGWLSRLAAVAAGPLAAAAAGALAGAAIGLAVDKYILKKGLGIDIGEQLGVVMSKKEAFREAQIRMSAGGMTRTDILKNVSAMAASGKSAEEIQNFLLKQASNVRGIHGDALTKERRQKIMEGIIQDAGQEITRQRVRAGHTSLTEQSDTDRAKQDELIKLFKAVAMNTEFSNKLLKRAEDKHELIETTKMARADESLEEARVRRQAYERAQSAQSNANSYSGPPGR